MVDENQVSSWHYWTNSAMSDGNCSAVPSKPTKIRETWFVVSGTNWASNLDCCDTCYS